MISSVTGEHRPASVSVVGRALVRRFTDEQDGTTTLGCAAKAAQKEDDFELDRKERERLGTYFRDLPGDRKDTYFQIAEDARKQLDQTCREFEKSEKPFRFSKVFGHRQASRTAANEVLQEHITSDIEELERIVNGIETKWQKGQSKAFNHLRALCSTLHAHKLALGLVPSQNDYAASLCGGIKLLISAAVNYDDIAELLSEQVAHMSSKVSLVADLLGIIGTQRMYELYADLHAQVFLFYRDVIAWYLDRKRGRFFGSFNEQLKRTYEKTIDRIENCLSLLEASSRNAQTAMMRISLMNTEELRRETRRHRQQPLEQANLGALAQEFLYVIFNSRFADLINDQMKEKNRIQAFESGVETEPETKPEAARKAVRVKTVSRATGLKYINQLLPFVVGDEGQSLFDDSRFWIPDAEASPRLVEWMNPHENQSRLWINSPLVTQRFPSSRAAAMTAVVAAWHAHVPIISHFCECPKIQDVPTGGNREKTGLIGLIYSLIVQLLQFCNPEDAFEIPEDQIKALDGSDESWEIALQTFSDLLRATPLLKICVIDDLNILTLSVGMNWCTEFLDVLFEHLETCEYPFRVLLTTAGSSRVISKHFKRDERIFVQREAQEVLRRRIQNLEPAGIGE